MNTRNFTKLVLALGAVTVLWPQVYAAPLGTAFSYQGRLADGGAPANGLYDLRFTLFDAASGGAAVGTPSVVTANATPVSNGVFAVSLDFGTAFAGQARWLGIEVKTNLAATFDLLSPRTELAPAPNAVYASRAGVADGVAPGSVTSAGLAPGSVNGSTIANGTVGIGDLNAFLLNETFWRLGGNAGTTPGTSFLGTTDNQPLELRVNNRGALRLQPTPDSPNVIGGHPDNSVSSGTRGIFIGGGGLFLENRNHVSTNYSAVVGGYANRVDAIASVIGGGSGNNIAADSHGSTIVGGTSSGVLVQSPQSAIGGGYINIVSNDSPESVIAGGYNNLVGHHSRVSTVGGGSLNRIGDLSRGTTIAGGESNQVGTNSPGSAIGGGRMNVIDAHLPDTTIAGGTRNRIGTNSYHSFIGGGGNNDISSNALASVIGGGAFNSVGYASTHSTIAGGGGNSIGTNSFGSVISGGSGNRIESSSQHSTIAGGRDQRIGTNAHFSVIAGGSQNTNTGFYAAVPGGLQNQADGDFAFAAGRRAKANHRGAFVWADSTDADFPSTKTNQIRIRAAGGMEVVGSNQSETLKFSASRPGDFSLPVGLAMNNNTVGNSAPAMRVVNAGGNSVDGALSVSAAGTGFIAKFGNSSTFVSSLATDGTWSALAFNSTSDRAAKENFSAVNPSEVLEKVAALPMSRWTYKSAPGVEHIGPVAQDFYAAFGLNGDDDKHIATVDADGVALAAIQGLNKKLEQEMRIKEARIEALEKQLADLKELLLKTK